MSHAASRAQRCAQCGEDTYQYLHNLETPLAPLLRGD